MYYGTRTIWRLTPGLLTRSHKPDVIQTPNQAYALAKTRRPGEFGTRSALPHSSLPSWASATCNARRQFLLNSQQGGSLNESSIASALSVSCTSNGCGPPPREP